MIAGLASPDPTYQPHQKKTLPSRIQDGT